MASKPINILGICGSLRPASYNRALLANAEKLLPDGAALALFDIAAIPLYHEDVYQQGFPEPVAALRTQINASDALLIASPEYNHSVSGVLKNAIDWVSRPPDQPFSRKPIAIMGASPGLFATVRGQAHLRQIFVPLNAYVLPRPEVAVASAATRFDQQGVLTDAKTQDAMRALLAALVELARTLTRG